MRERKQRAAALTHFCAYSAMHLKTSTTSSPEDETNKKTQVRAESIPVKITHLTRHLEDRLVLLSDAFFGLERVELMGRDIDIWKKIDGGLTVAEIAEALPYSKFNDVSTTIDRLCSSEMLELKEEK